MYQVNKTPGILLLWLKVPVIYYTLHRVWNIDVHKAENSISGPFEFNIFWEDMPPDPQEARAFGARI